MQTDDGALIGLTYRGMRHGPAEVMDKIARGETVSPADYYLRIQPLFETASEKYAFLNRMLTHRHRPSPRGRADLSCVRGGRGAVLDGTDNHGCKIGGRINSAAGVLRALHDDDVFGTDLLDPVVLVT